MHPLSSSCTFLFAAALAIAAGVRAEEPESGSATQRAPAVPRPPALAPPADGMSGAAAADDVLERARGGTDITIIDTTLGGTVTGNTATNVVTGWNVIQSGSFANMSGIPIVVQNSGANVLIQNATVINVQLK